MSTVTCHGENIANQIQDEDAYGDSDALTDADIWLIIDNMHSALMDTRELNDPMVLVLGRILNTLAAMDIDLPL